ncbi:MAG: hypothetical protein K0U38_03115 [Epsilonproteobacteria bacterium]|nr:hypothetical protein [Campylobacterota bacterium]
MSFFSASKTQTKIFVNQLEEIKSKSLGEQKQTGRKGLNPISMATEALIEIAPDLIDEGLKQLSSTIKAFSEDYTSETFLHKNIDGDSKESIFIPKYITIIRADFTSDNMLCHDGFTMPNEQCDKIESPELRIDLEIKLSDDHQAFYFQPLNYFYVGKDTKNKKIDEINLSFGFISATENISNVKDVELKQIINFNDLENSHKYSFKEDKHYDTTYQSPWISSESSKKGPYTMLFKIEERRQSSEFRKNLHKIYDKHEDTLRKRINKDIKVQLDKLPKTNNTNESSQSS